MKDILLRAARLSAKKSMLPADGTAGDLRMGGLSVAVNARTHLQKHGAAASHLSDMWIAISTETLLQEVQGHVTFIALGERSEMGKRPAKEFQTSLLLDPAVKEKAQIAAARAGRSTSAELRLRIERSFADEEAGSSLTSPIVRMIAQGIRAAEEKSGKKWYDDFETAAECRRIIAGIMRLLLHESGREFHFIHTVDAALGALRQTPREKYEDLEWSFIVGKIIELQHVTKKLIDEGKDLTGLV